MDIFVRQKEDSRKKINPDNVFKEHLGFKYNILYFRFFLLLLLISYSFSDLSLGTFPYIKRLKNKKFIVLDSNGISLIDENFQNYEKTINSTPSADYNSKSATIAQFSGSDEYDNLIIVIYKTNLYILSDELDILAEQEYDNYINNDNFYSIVPCIVTDNIYSFYVIYLDKENDKIKYYEGHYEDNIIYLEGFTFEYVSVQIDLFDCTLMKYNDYKFITCFYGDEKNYRSFMLDFIGLIGINSYQFPVEESTERHCFKSLALPGNEKSIVCSYSTNKIFDCALYDSKTNQLYNYTKIEIEYDDFYSFNIFMEYIEETNEVLIGKPSSENKISLIKCSKEFECSDIYTQTLEGISRISTVNIIYISNEKKYYIIATQFDNHKVFKFALDVTVILRCEQYFNYDKTSCLSYIPKGYYCNSTEDKTLEKCYSNCSTCDEESNNLNKCLTCDHENNYYSLYNETNEYTNEYITCYYKDTIFDGLYLNKINKIFEPCSQECKTCLEFNKCRTCNNESGFYPLNDNTGNQYKACYHEDTTVEGFYFNSSAKVFESCYIACKNCSDYDKCLSCNNEKGYYQLYNETNNLVKIVLIMINVFLVIMKKVIINYIMRLIIYI